jgi:ribosome-binding protein aMBF1 (putative translation factor)
VSENDRLLGRQIAAGRVLAGLSQPVLAARAKISVPTLRRMEAAEGATGGYINNVNAVRRALEEEGIEFLNGGKPGVRLKFRPAPER